MLWLVITLYSLSMLFIFIYSLGQLQLTIAYLKNKRIIAEPLPTSPSYRVTIQLPVYNEMYVAERLLHCITQFDYPKNLIDIQVLDDSTDDTVDIIKNEVLKYQKLGFDIQHIQRPQRQGYKAGALAFGTTIAKGELIAIFDADFLPKPDFLNLTLQHFQDPNIGLVQTKWSHINKDYSMLTKLQAFGLDAHFSVEQAGRNFSGSFINFNGTAGVWRKECIVDAGGWSSDTLTEDLDLSYRAQLKGWSFKYLENVDSPAELPVVMSAVKSQQYRWNKGAAESVRKLLGKVIKSDLKLKTKFHAVTHLLNSSVFLFLLLSALLSVPMLYLKQTNKHLEWIFDLGSVFLLGFLFVGFFYFVATKSVIHFQTKRYFFKHYFLFLAFSMGLSLHNTIAVLQGYFGKKSPFIRTPKFNIFNSRSSELTNKYISRQLSVSTFVEAILAAYFLFGVYLGWFYHDFGLIIFHILLTLGFASVFCLTIKK